MLSSNYTTRSQQGISEEAMHLYMHPCVDIISRGSLTQGTLFVLYHIILFFHRISLSAIELYHYISKIVFIFAVNGEFIISPYLSTLSLSRLRLYGLLSQDYTLNSTSA